MKREVSPEKIKKIKKALTQTLGEDKVEFRDFAMCSYVRDTGTVLHVPPMTEPCVVTFPETTQEVQAIVKLANNYGIPVVATAGRTSYWGAIDSCGGIVIDTLPNMNKEIVIDEQNRTVTAQVGVPVKYICEELEKRGYAYLTHPIHDAPITFGSDISKCSGGQAGGSHEGYVSHRVIGLEAVTGTGEIIQTGSSHVINTIRKPFTQAGLPDLTQLFVASEGAYGVITKVTMRISKKPVAWAFPCFSFPGTDGGMRAVLAAMKEIADKEIDFDQMLTDWNTGLYYARYFKPIREMMAPTLAVMGIGEKQLMEMPPETARQIFGFPLLTSCISFYSQQDCDLKEKEIERICLKKYNAVKLPPIFSVVESPEKGMLWSGYPRAAFPGGLNWAWIIYASISNDQMIEFFHEFQRVVKKNNIPEANSSFDSHYAEHTHQIVYPIVFFDSRNKDEVEKMKSYRYDLQEAAVKVGVIPYRTGRMWRDVLIDELDPVYRNWIMKIKKLFDPNNIMNPGVSVFDEY